MKILMLSALLALNGCRTDESTSSSDKTISVFERFENRITASGEIEFVCRKGKMEGWDNDWCLHFYPSGNLELAWYSIGPQYIKGTYVVAPDARIVINLNSSSKNSLIMNWPVMILKFEDGILKLYREDGVTVQDPQYQDDKPNFWPFHEKLPEAEQAASSNR